MQRITERELVLPALYAMDIAGGSIRTTDLRRALEGMLNPTGEDLEILSGRRDNKFSQKVRNLKAHDTLLNDGLATHTQNGFIITDAGRETLSQNRHKLETLFEFAPNDIASELRQISVSQGVDIEYIDERIITEGELRTRTVEYRSRSGELRSAAFEHYSQNGVISCHACGFDFALAYPDIGNGTIQIHHLKPVSYMRGEPLKLRDALRNVRPLCANCHLMVHKKNPPITIDELMKILQVSYDYI